MAINTDKNSYTIIFAIIMVVVVGSILAFASQGLKGNIDENKRVEKQQNILYALGINENDESSVTFVSKSKVAAKPFCGYMNYQFFEWCHYLIDTLYLH